MHKIFSPQNAGYNAIWNKVDPEQIELILDKYRALILDTYGVERECESLLLKKFSSANSIKVLKGIRKCGKSFLLKRLLKKLIEKQVHKLEDVFYFDFDNFTIKDSITDIMKLQQICEFLIGPSQRISPKLFVFDGIQNLPHWDKFIQAFWDNASLHKVEIFITASNGELASLKPDSEAKLVEYELFPFSFREFLKAHGLEIKTEIAFEENKIRISKLFEAYYNFGSFPELLSIRDSSAKLSYLDGLKSKILLDDIATKIKGANIDSINLILPYLFKNVGNQISLSKIQDHLKKYNRKLDEITIGNHLNLLLKTFFIHDSVTFDWNTAKVLKKYYCVDPGLISLYSPSGDNFLKVLENIFYFELKRKNSNAGIFYEINGQGEASFIVDNKDRNQLMKYHLGKLNNSKVMIDSYEIADRFLAYGENFFVSLDESNPNEQENLMQKPIAKLNLKNWLLNQI